MNNNILRCILIIGFSASLLACSEEASKELELEEIIKPQLEAMEKAKQVEGLLQDAAEQREQSLEQQEY